MENINQIWKRQEAAHDCAFRAVELALASQTITMPYHHRYRSETARNVLRREAAKLLWEARLYSVSSASKVWKQHYKLQTV